MTRLAIALVLACSTPRPELQTVELGATGYVIDVPKGWTVESPMSGFYELKGGHPHPQIITAPAPPSDLETLAKNTCDGRRDVRKEHLPGGGVLVACEGAFVVEIPKGDRASFDCQLESDQDPATAIAICTSIRKPR